MNVVCLHGGLGNQMFQYAFGIALGGGVKYDLSWFGGENANRNYGLGAFVGPVSILTQREYKIYIEGYRFCGIPLRRPLCKHICERDACQYCPELLMESDGVFNGYYQAAPYYEPIREKILEAFRLKDEPKDGEYARIKALIRSTESISVHVRRGDYLSLQDVYAICGRDYYLRAVDMIQSTVMVPRFFIFTEDVAWAQENLSFIGDAQIVDTSMYHGHPEFDLMLMKECKHNIIANSSYSWWGAWLNENPRKMVVAPKAWFANGRKVDLYCPRWVCV